MNYLELIQAVTKIYAQTSPSAFSDTSTNEYYKVREAIEEAAKDLFFDNFHKFRERQTTLTTVDGQAAYPHSYGVIKKMKVLNDNSYYQDLIEVKDFAEIEKLYLNSDESLPMYFCIFGEEIFLYPVPDTTYTVKIYYNSPNWAKFVQQTDQQSASGQAKVYVGETEGFSSGDTVLIAPNTANEESGVISTVTNDDYITLTSNLSNTHAVGIYVENPKKSFDYQYDEPNFPSEWHDIIKTRALLLLYLSDGDVNEAQRYQAQYDKRYKYMKREIRGTESTNFGFKFKRN